MNPDLQAYLDGEKRLDELTGEARTEAEAWDRMVSSARVTTLSKTPDWVEDAVMSEIHAMAAHRREESLLGWILRPKTIRVSPLMGGLITAALAALILWPTETPLAPGPAPGPAGITQVFVEFSLQAPNANSVAVAGDFSEWEALYSLEDRDGDGVWTGRVPIEPGVHEYMFVIDDSNWVTDPRADRYNDDGFGNRNAVLAVGATE